MPDYEFDWVDAFADTPMTGNPCVVVHDAAAISVEDRLRLVRETRLSECAYLVPSETADFGARYYLADRAIPLAGHPTVATVTSLVSRGMVDMANGPTSFTLELGVGVISVEVAGTVAAPIVTMTQPAPVFGEMADPAEVAEVYGLTADDVVGRPQVVSTGATHCITVLRGHEALAAAFLQTDKLATWQARLAHPNAASIQPFLVTRSGMTPAGDTFSRLLLAPPLPAEDPFTGSATGEMAAYLWRHGLIDSPTFVAEQGHLMDRPGLAQVEVLGPPEAITGVRVGGAGRVLMRGTLTL